MSFGQRTSPPAPPLQTAHSRTGGPPRRGGYWLGVLTVPLAGLVGMVATSLMPLVNPTDRSLMEMPVLIGVALLNITVVAAVLMFLIDLPLKRAPWRRPWVYALICGLAVFGVCWALNPGKSLSTAVFLAGVALLPGAAGGWVMGLFRR